jgi:hypothetical protein
MSTEYSERIEAVYDETEQQAAEVLRHAVHELERAQAKLRDIFRKANREILSVAAASRDEEFEDAFVNDEVHDFTFNVDAVDEEGGHFDVAIGELREELDWVEEDAQNKRDALHSLFEDEK